jgi:small subunit ribosomal protein S1
LSEEHVAKVKDVLKVGQEVEARVIKVDKVERRIGLSIKAANYTEEQLRKEAETFDTLRPGEDMVGLEKAFAAAEQEEYRPGESKKEPKAAKEPKEPKEAKEPKEPKAKKESKKK